MIFDNENWHWKSDLGFFEDRFESQWKWSQLKKNQELIFDQTYSQLPLVLKTQPVACQIII